MIYRIAAVMIILLAATRSAAVGADALPAPKFKASLVCFIGKADSASFCRATMAKIEGGLRTVHGTLTCGYKGEVSEITWTYRGHKDGNDVYHIVRKFGAEKAKEAVIHFNGKRQVVFEDHAQCIIVELQQPGR